MCDDRGGGGGQSSASPSRVPGLPRAARCDPADVFTGAMHRAPGDPQAQARVRVRLPGGNGVEEEAPRSWPGHADHLLTGPRVAGVARGAGVGRPRNGRAHPIPSVSDALDGPRERERCGHPRSSGHCSSESCQGLRDWRLQVRWAVLPVSDSAARWWSPRRFLPATTPPPPKRTHVMCCIKAARVYWVSSGAEAKQRHCQNTCAHRHTHPQFTRRGDWMHPMNTILARPQ